MGQLVPLTHISRSALGYYLPAAVGLGSSRLAQPGAVFEGINPCVLLVAPWGGTATLPSFEDKAEAWGLGKHWADRQSQD